MCFISYWYSRTYNMAYFLLYIYNDGKNRLSNRLLLI